MFRSFATTLVLSAALGLVVGCGDTAKDKVAKSTPKKVDDHSGWWCDEHGIPEHECSLCMEDGEKHYRAKGDWCELHQRAKSQCFKCDPSLYEKVFEPKYVAKYGKKPERPDKEEFEK